MEMTTIITVGISFWNIFSMCLEIHIYKTKIKIIKMGLKIAQHFKAAFTFNTF